MPTDLHVHTLFSCDSNTSMEEYCVEAIKQGVTFLCFTDHVDFNNRDMGYDYYKPEEYFAELNRVKDKYSDKVTILSGMEFSEPHIYRKEFDKLSKLPYDFVLGSVHFWIDDLFASELLAKGIPLKEAFEKYWIEVLKAVSCGGFDSLAHIDFPKRYYKDSYWDESMVSDIFKAMIKNNISLEINTSSLRKGLSETLPGKALLDLYIKSGGINVTIGSDAHSATVLAKDYDAAINMLGPSLVNGYYEKRKFRTF